jgi:hypothetical protein
VALDSDGNRESARCAPVLNRRAFDLVWGTATPRYVGSLPRQAF